MKRTIGGVLADSRGRKARKKLRPTSDMRPGIAANGGRLCSAVADICTAHVEPSRCACLELDSPPKAVPPLAIPVAVS